MCEYLPRHIIRGNEDILGGKTILHEPDNIPGAKILFIIFRLLLLLNQLPNYYALISEGRRMPKAIFWIPKSMFARQNFVDLFVLISYIHAEQNAWKWYANTTSWRCASSSICIAKCSLMSLCTLWNHNDSYHCDITAKIPITMSRS